MGHGGAEGSINEYRLFRREVQTLLLHPHDDIHLSYIDVRLAQNSNTWRSEWAKANRWSDPVPITVATSVAGSTPAYFETGLRLSRHPGPHPQDTKSLNNLAGLIL
jgi:hypothetical protein